MCNILNSADNGGLWATTDVMALHNSWLENIYVIKLYKWVGFDRYDFFFTTA